MAGASLSYVLTDDPALAGPEDSLDLATAPGFQIFFSCFTGDVDLVLNDVSFRANVAWVSTLGFALGFCRVVRGLRANSEERMQFQDDDRWIALRREIKDVTVTCSYVDDAQKVSYDDLNRAVFVGLESLTRILTSRYPRLNANPVLQKALAEIGLPGDFAG